MLRGNFFSLLRNNILNLSTLPLVVDLSIFFVVIILYLATSYVAGYQYTYLALPLLIAAYYLRVGVSSRKMIWRALAIGLAVVAAIIGVYFYTNYSRLIYTLWYSPLEIAMATVLLILVLNYCRMRHPVLFFIIIALFIYSTPYVGRILPEPFFHLGLPWVRYITANTLETTGAVGIFGNLTAIGLQIIAPILILLGLMEGFGILRSIGKIVVASVKRPRMIPLLNPVASAFVGTMTGSISSDTAVTGSVTIPLMKRIGIPPDWAGAIAAVSGVGAYIMPPIMGTVAFILPAFLGTTYWEVAVRAFLPALAYFTSLMIFIYIISRIFVRSKLTVGGGIGSQGEKVELGDYLNFAGFVLSLSILIFMMGVWRYELPTATYYTLLVFITYAVATKAMYGLAVKKGSKEIAADIVRSFLSGVKAGVATVVEVTLLLASLGVMIGMMTAVGLIQDINWVLLDVFGKSLWMIVAIAYVFGILMGLALPAIATYIALAILLIPTMIKLGIDPWAAHFFGLYLAVISEFTPPTSIGAVVAAGIAGANALRVMAYMAILGLPIYLFPIYILVNPQVVTFSVSGAINSFLLVAFSIGLTTPLLLALLRNTVKIDLFTAAIAAAQPPLAIAVMAFSPGYVKIVIACAILASIMFLLRRLRTKEE